MAGDGGVLCGLLDEELAYDATTPRDLTNHLPMALVALERLGADDARLTAFARRYARRLGPVEPGAAITSPAAWRAARGVRGAYGELRGFLAREVAESGQDAVVRRYLHELADGLSGAAFHGVIRLAYALEARSDARVAAGLAYLTAVYQPLGARRGSAPRTADPAEALGWLAGRRELVEARRDGNIGARMAQVAAHPGFDGVVDWLDVDGATPERLVDAAVRLYAATDDFVALHGVTASHALLGLSAYVQDAGALASWWFQALAAAYVTIGAPPIISAADAVAPWEEEAGAGWEAAAAVASDDEHVCKLVYSARELGRGFDHPLLFGCAARQARLAPEGHSAGR